MGARYRRTATENIRCWCLSLGKKLRQNLIGEVLTTHPLIHNTMQVSESPDKLKLLQITTKFRMVTSVN